MRQFFSRELQRHLTKMHVTQERRDYERKFGGKKTWKRRNEKLEHLELILKCFFTSMMKFSIIVRMKRPRFGIDIWFE